MGELVKVRLSTNFENEAIVFIPHDCPWDRLKGVVVLRLGIQGKIDHLLLVDKNNEELSGCIRDTSTLCSFFELYHADDDMAFLVYLSDAADIQDQNNEESDNSNAVEDSSSSFSKSLQDLMASIDVQSQSWTNDIRHPSSTEDIIKEIDTNRPLSDKLLIHSDSSNMSPISSSEIETMAFSIDSNGLNKYEISISQDLSWVELIRVISSRLSDKIDSMKSIDYFTLHDHDGDEVSSSITTITKLWKSWNNFKNEVGIYFVIHTKDTISVSTNKTSLETSSNEVDSRFTYSTNDVRTSNTSVDTVHPPSSPTNTISTSNTIDTTSSITVETRNDSKYHDVFVKLSTAPNETSRFTVPIDCSWAQLTHKIAEGLSLSSPSDVDYIVLIDDDGDDLSPPINSEGKFRKFDAIYGENEDMLCVVYLVESNSSAAPEKLPPPPPVVAPLSLPPTVLPIAPVASGALSSATLQSKSLASLTQTAARTATNAPSPSPSSSALTPTAGQLRARSLNTFVFALALEESSCGPSFTLQVPLECNWTVLSEVLLASLSVTGKEITHLVLVDDQNKGAISPTVDTDTKFWKYAQRYRERGNALFLVHTSEKGARDEADLLASEKSTRQVWVCVNQNTSDRVSVEVPVSAGWNQLIETLVQPFGNIKVYSVDHLVVLGGPDRVDSSPVITDTQTLWKHINDRKNLNVLVSIQQAGATTSYGKIGGNLVEGNHSLNHLSTTPILKKNEILVSVKFSSSPASVESRKVVITRNAAWEEVSKMFSEAFDGGSAEVVDYVILSDVDGDELSPPLNTTQKFWKFGNDFMSDDGSYFQVFFKPKPVEEESEIPSAEPPVTSPMVAMKMLLATNNTVAGRLSFEVVALPLNCSWDVIVEEARRMFELGNHEELQYLILVDNDGNNISPKLDNAIKFWKFGQGFADGSADSSGHKFTVYTKTISSINEEMGRVALDDEVDTNEESLAVIHVTLAGNLNRKGIARLKPNLSEQDVMVLIAESLGTNQTKWIVSLSVEDNLGVELTGPLMGSTGFWKLYSKGYLANKENHVVVYGEFPITLNNTTEQFLNACAQGDRHVVKRLLALSDHSIVQGQDDEGMRPLHHASKGGHLEVVRLLINVENDVDSGDKKGMTPLHYACANMFPEVALFLAKHGASVIVKNSVGLTPLHYVCLRGMIQVAEQFLTAETMNLATSSGLSLLHCACDRGHLDVVEYLLTHGARVQCYDNEGLTPLQYTCLRGHLQVAQCLVAHGAFINTRDQDGMSAFLYACSDGHIELAKWLVATGASLNARSNAGNNALHLAADIGDKELLRWLLDCGMDINARSYDGLTPVHLALKMGHVDAALLLEAAGAKNKPENDDDAAERLRLDKLAEEALRLSESSSEDRPSGDDSEGGINAVTSPVPAEDTEMDGPLRDACAVGDLEKVKRILSGPVNVHSRNENGSRPIHFAAVSGSLEIAEMLFDGGADITVANNRGSTALHFACDRKHVDLAIWLYEHGASLVAKTSEGYTPLHYVCVRGLDQLLQTLAEKAKQLDVNVCDNRKFSLLHCAAEEGHADVVRLLAKLKANVNAKDQEERIPLHLACLRGHLAVAKLLVEHNAEINLEDQDGNTPMFYACLGGNLELSKWLIATGATLGRGNKRGNTCLHAACQIGHKEMALWLIQAGLRLDVKNTNGHTPIDFAYEANYQSLGKLLEKKLEEIHSSNKNRLEQLTAFHDACIGPDIKLVEHFLDNGSDPNALNENDSNALHFSCASGQEDTTKLLITAGANVNAANNTGLTPFHCACLGGHLSLAKYLVHHVGVDFQKKTNNGANALHHSAHNGHLKVVKWLVSLGVSMESTKQDGYKVIHEACRGGHLAVVKYLVKQGVSLSSLTRDGVSTMHVACSMGFTELAQWLNGEGVSIDAADAHGITPLLAGCAGGHIRTVKWLVSMGVNSRAKGGVLDVLDTALHHACRNGHMETVKFLMDIGLDAYELNEKSQTAIEIASNEDNADVAFWLLARGPHYLYENMARGSIHPHLDMSIANKKYDETHTILLDLLSDVNPNLAPGTTPLHFAAVAGNLDFTQYLVTICKVPVDVDTIVGMTPLHYAAYAGRFDIVQYLVGEGSKIDKTTLTGDTPESIASHSGHAYISRWLQDKSVVAHEKSALASAFACVSAADTTVRKTISSIPSITTSPTTSAVEKKSSRSLLFACISTDLPMISFASDVFSSTPGDNKKEVFEERDTDSESEPFDPQLHDAITDGRLDNIRRIIDNGAEVNVANPTVGNTPLHVAAVSGNCSIAEILVDKGAKLDVQNNIGMTALHIACDNRHTQFSLFLIRKGADLQIRNKAGDTPLHRICSRGMIDLVQKIIELPRSVLRVLDLDIKTDKGVSPLHCAVENGHIDIVKVLIAQTVNVNPRDEENRTPLHYACVKGYYEISDILIRNGAFVKARDNQGCSPLLCAAMARNFPLAKLLNIHGANVFADDAQGNNALHIACKSGEVEMAKWLVSLNVNPSQANNAGVTPIQYANEGGFSELFEWLLAWTLAKSVGGSVEDVLAEARSASSGGYDVDGITEGALNEGDDDEEEEDEDDDADGGGDIGTESVKPIPRYYEDDTV